MKHKYIILSLLVNINYWGGQLQYKVVVYLVGNFP